MKKEILKMEKEIIKIEEKNIHKIFKIVLIIKSIIGFFEIFVAAILLFMLPFIENRLMPFLFRQELMQDPTDFVANYILSFFKNLSFNTEILIVIYLTIHGIIKIGLVLAFLGKNYKFYRVALGVLILFIFYEVYLFFQHYSLIILFAITLDIAIAFLAWHEYRKHYNKNIFQKIGLIK